MPYAKFYLLVLVVGALIVAVVMAPLSLVIKVTVKVVLAYLAILFGLWLFGRRHSQM